MHLHLYEAAIGAAARTLDAVRPSRMAAVVARRILPRRWVRMVFALVVEGGAMLGICVFHYNQ